MPGNTVFAEMDRSLFSRAIVRINETSAAFDALPADVRNEIYRRLYAVLSGKDQSRKFGKLSESDRKAIFEIVSDTKKNLPEWWR